MEQKTGKNYSARIIEEVDLELKAQAAVEGLADRNGHIQKVVGEGKSVSWGGAWTKGKGNECKITKYMFLHSDLLKQCLKKKHNITEFFQDTTVFYDQKTRIAWQWGKYRAINQLKHNMHKFELR